ncbi:MAG: hypothetical protein ABW275_04360 [Hansschlegelia sp.]
MCAEVVDHTAGSRGSVGDVPAPSIEWDEPAEGRVFDGPTLPIAGRMRSASRIAHVSLVIDGEEASALTLTTVSEPGGEAILFAGELPLDGRPCRLPLELKIVGEDGETTTSPSRLVWRASYRPDQPLMPVVSFDCVVKRGFAGRLSVRGDARSEGVALRSVAFWRAGRLLATSPIDADGAFKATLTAKGDAIHAWLEDADGREIYAGPAGFERWRLNSTRAGLAFNGWLDYLEGHIDLLISGDDAPSAVICLNGRPLPDDFTPVEAEGAIGRLGRLFGGPSLVFAESVVGDDVLCRLPIWNWEGTAFQIFRDAVHRRSLVKLTTRTGGRLTRLAPVKLLAQRDGWRLYFRSGARPLEIRERQIARIALENTRYDASNDWRTRKHLRSDEPIGGDAWRALGRPIVLPSRGRAIPPVETGPRRVVLIRSQPFPTDEIYVIAPLQPLIEAGEVELVVVDTNKEENAGGATEATLRDGDIVLIVRYVTPRWLRRVTEARRRISIVYLVDDDLPSAIDSPGLPQHYRRRMADVAAWDFQAMLRLCDRLVVTSQHLAERFASPKTMLLVPPWIRREGSLDHHDGRRVKIGYHGTDVHSEDIEMLLPAVERVVEANENVEFEVFSGGAADRLIDRPRFTVLKPMPWPDFKTYARENPCHVMLAPLLDTPFNAGKSIIKFCDAASAGAAGLYSDLSPYRDFVTDGVDGFLIRNDPELWEAALGQLVASPERVSGTARACRDTAAALRPVEAATRFWSEMLMGDEPEPEGAVAKALKAVAKLTSMQ